MKNNFLGGVWPTMLTPFKGNEVDYESLGKLVDWYINNGASGLFAVCQSSEMFFLTLEERVKIAKFVKEKAGKRVKVIASGHISDSLEDQAKELNEIAKTGVDAIILITNRLAKSEENEDVWLNNLEKLISKLPLDVPLGLYECPYPYKRLLTEKMIKFCVQSERFFFLKDTCCDIEMIKKRFDLTKGSNLKIYNANTTTLLDSLNLGCAGYSGVMANFQLPLYAKLCENPEIAKELAQELSIHSLIERQLYPVNAKAYLQSIGVFHEITTRTKDIKEFSLTFSEEVKSLIAITKRLEKIYL